MTREPVDLRDLPPDERHAAVFKVFEQLDPGETLTLINDYNPRPLLRQMEGSVKAFDAEGYSVEQEGEHRFVVELPKRQPSDPDEGIVKKIRVRRSSVVTGIPPGLLIPIDVSNIVPTVTVRRVPPGCRFEHPLPRREGRYHRP